MLHETAAAILATGIILDKYSTTSSELENGTRYQVVSSMIRLTGGVSSERRAAARQHRGWSNDSAAKDRNKILPVARLDVLEPITIHSYLIYLVEVR